MDTLRRLLLEDPWWVCIALGAVACGLLAAWRRRDDRRFALAATAPVLLAGAVAVTAWVVRTDREQIAAALRDIADGAVAGDLVAAEPHLDADLRAPGPAGLTLGRGRVLAMGRAALKLWPLSAVSISKVETRVSGPSATTVVHAGLHFGKGSMLEGQTMQTSWRVQWVRRAGGWRVARVEATEPSVLAEWRYLDNLGP